jgi:hypothetical protein
LFVDEENVEFAKIIMYYAKQKINKYQRLSRACIVHLVIKRTNWSYVKTMSCSGSHLGITINIKNMKFVKVLMPIRNPRWLPPQVIVLTQDHMGKNRNIFSSEAIALIEPN